MWWQEQSWPKIEVMDKDTPVMIPLASLEQHGGHLPLFVDTIQVSAIAERANEQLGGRVLTMPTLWLGCSHHHMDYPGTVSVLPHVYHQMIKSVARSVMHAGFKRLFFLNGHGGNTVPASDALTELADEDDQADASLIALATWWQLAGEALTDEKHGMSTPKLTHACEYETSVMLSLRPELVDTSAIRAGEPGDDHAKRHASRWPGVTTFQRFHRMTRGGHMGVPSEASAEKGASLLDAVVGRVVEFVADFAQWPGSEKHGPA